MTTSKTHDAWHASPLSSRMLVHPGPRTRHVARFQGCTHSHHHQPHRHPDRPQGMDSAPTTEIVASSHSAGQKKNRPPHRLYLRPQPPPPPHPRPSNIPLPPLLPKSKANLLKHVPLCTKMQHKPIAKYPKTMKIEKYNPPKHLC